MSHKTLYWLLLDCWSRCKVFWTTSQCWLRNMWHFWGHYFLHHTVLHYTNCTADTIVIITDNSVAKWLRKEDQCSEMDKIVLTIFVRNGGRCQKHSSCNVLYSLFYIFHSVHYNLISTILTNVYTQLLLDLQ